MTLYMSSSYWKLELKAPNMFGDKPFPILFRKKIELIGERFETKEAP